MTLLDVGAGGGWFTRVLSAATGPSGKVIAQFGPRALQRENGQGPKDLAASLGNTEAFFGNVADIPPNSVDAAVTALNMHHMNAERAGPYLKEIFTVLKPGGRAAIIDHVGLREIDNSQLHRMLPSDVKTWIQAAGFEIVTESDILRTTADDHKLSVDDPILGTRRRSVSLRRAQAAAISSARNGRPTLCASIGACRLMTSVESAVSCSAAGGDAWPARRRRRASASCRRRTACP